MDMKKYPTLDKFLENVSYQIAMHAFYYTSVQLGRQMPWYNDAHEAQPLRFYVRGAFFHVIRKYIPEDILKRGKERYGEDLKKPVTVKYLEDPVVKAADYICTQVKFLYEKLSTEKMKKRREKRAHNKWIRDNTWRDLIPGDVVEYNGERLMYRGINTSGGPGMAGFAEPVFGPADPKKGNLIQYIRVPFNHKKIDHITPDKWDEMVENVKVELAGAGK